MREFNVLIEKFIERETEGTGEVPTEVLFEALPDFLAAMGRVSLRSYCPFVQTVTLWYHHSHQWEMLLKG